MRTAAVIGLLVIGAVIAATVILFAGFYNVAATQQHFVATYHVLDTALRESVKHHSRKIVVPPLDDAALVERGLAQYAEHCVRCHGAPGVAPEPFALGMIPVPTNLAHVARVWRADELYWTVKNGIKMTGMPAWEFRLHADDIWAIVAFLRVLPWIAPEDYRARAARAQHVDAATTATSEPSATRGKTAIIQYACLTCHRVPGLVGPNAPVGPPLDEIATREYIAGVLPNTWENMIRWLRDPQEVNPRSAMPDLGVSERDARDIAAYLYTLK
jgi:mono/diheme cytochrome c family protein